MAPMTPDDWRARGEYFEWRGHSIFFRVEGSGEPLLAIHGFPTASWDWCAMWPALVARHRVMTLDMIGFGFSAKPRDYEYSIARQADLQEALLERERVTSYRLLAHDYGDTVAQELLARQRGATARIVSACLLNGGLFPESHHATVTQKLLASPLGPLVAKLSSYRTFAATMRRIWGKRPPSEDDLRAMWQLVTANDLSVPRPSGRGTETPYNDGLAAMPKIIGYIEERRRHRERWVGALVGATIPIRLVDGVLDPVSGAHMVARYRELVPRPDVVELAGVGHYPQVEAPEAVTAAVLAHTTG